jgi:nicotinamide N-methyltransferase
MSPSRRPGVPATAVAASPIPSDRVLKSRYSDQSIEHNKKTRAGTYKASQKLDPKKDSGRPSGSGTLTNAPIINISVQNSHLPSPTSLSTSAPGDLGDAALADELDYITVTTPAISSPNALAPSRADKASRILGIRHRRSMEPIPASTRNSIVSTRSLRDAPPLASYIPTLPLTSLYVVSGLPKSPHTWTLADPDSVLGLHHSESAVNRWWRPEVLGSTVSPGAGGGKKKKRGKNEETLKGAGALSKQEVGKMLSKALKVSTTKLSYDNA